MIVIENLYLVEWSSSGEWSRQWWSGAGEPAARMNGIDTPPPPGQRPRAQLIFGSMLNVHNSLLPSKLWDCAQFTQPTVLYTDNVNDGQLTLITEMFILCECKHWTILMLISY